MRYYTIGIVFLTLMSLAAGCATMGNQPAMSGASLDPPELTPGDSAILTVKVHDKYNIVRNVVGVIEGYEDVAEKLELRDDGIEPDAKAGDGIWSLEVDAPFLAPPGSFNILITAYDDQGRPVRVRTMKGPAPLVQTCKVVILFESGEGIDKPAASSAAPNAVGQPEASSTEAPKVETPPQ